jgi:hypothetical protein
MERSLPLVKQDPKGGAMRPKNINASDGTEQKNINETARTEWGRPSHADLDKITGRFFGFHPTTEAMNAVAKAIATISSATELEILGV